MAKKKEIKEVEVLEVTPTEVLPQEVGFENISQALLKQNITEEVLTAMYDEFMPLKINGVEDKENYKLVDEKRKMVKKVRVLTKDVCERGRAHAIAEQKLWIKKQGEVTDRLVVIESHLEAELKVIDAIVEAEKEKKQQEEATRIQSRTVQLLNLGMVLQGDNYVLNGLMINTLHLRIYDDFTYSQTLAPILVEAEKVKAEKEAEAIAFKKIQDDQAAERRKLDEERAAFELQQKNAKAEEELRLAKIEVDRKAFEDQQRYLQQAKEKARTAQVYALGMSFNGSDFVFGAVTLSKELLVSSSDTDFEQIILQITPKITVRKAEIEKERLDAVELEKNKAIAKSLADFEAKVKAEADAKVKELARIANEEAIAKQMEEAAIAKQEALKPDLDKFYEYLRKVDGLPVPEFTSIPYQEFSSFIKQTISQVCAHLDKKKPQ